MARILSAGMLLAVLYPIQENWQPTPEDGFPLSYYPMFSFKRGPFTNVTFGRVLMDGGARRLHYSFLGTGGFNQVRKQIRRVVVGDPGKARDHCDWVVRRMQPYVNRGVVFRVQFLTARFLRDDYFTGASGKPVNVVLHTECEGVGDGGAMSGVRARGDGNA